MVESERKGPEFIPYADWLVVDEKRRRRRSWLMGSITAAVVLVIFGGLMIPVLNRRAVISDLAHRFSRAEQIITTEERIGPNDVRFDRRVIEEAGKSRRVEVEDGNIVVFTSDEGGRRLDRKRRTLTSFNQGDLRETPFEIISKLLKTASRDVRTSVQKAEMSNGALKLDAEGFSYLIRPGEGRILATVDVQIDTDLGPTTLRRWRFERTYPDVSKFYAANYTRLRPVSARAWLEEETQTDTFDTSQGPGAVLRIDVNHLGDVFVYDSARYRLEYSVKSVDGALYSMIPLGFANLSMDRPGETERGSLAYRKRGTALLWPLKMSIEVRPQDTPDEKPKIIQRTFEGPTCSVVPDYEYGGVASDLPVLNHKLRSYLCEASLAETGFGLVRYANAEGPVKNPVLALTYFRFAFTYFGTNTRGTGARTYFSIFRCYEALNQTERAHAALRLAAERNNGRDPWLDQKINEAFLREGLVESE